MYQLKTFAIALSSVAWSVLAEPQGGIDASKVPDCAKGSIIAIQNNQCKWDVTCLCKDPAVVSTIKQYVRDHCSGDDLPAAFAFGESLCSQAGVTLTPERVNTASSPSTATTATFVTHSPSDPNVSWVTLASITSPTPLSLAPPTTGAGGARYGNGSCTTDSACSPHPTGPSTSPHNNGNMTSFTGGAASLSNVIVLPSWMMKTTGGGRFGGGPAFAAAVGLLGLVGVASFL